MFFRLTPKLLVLDGAESSLLLFVWPRNAPATSTLSVDLRNCRTPDSFHLTSGGGVDAHPFAAVSNIASRDLSQSILHRRTFSDYIRKTENAHV